MKIGVVPACLGRRDAGPETYERELLSGIASASPRHEFHVYCLSEAARETVRHLGDRLHLHTLWPSARALSLSSSLPLLLAKHGIEVYHATFVPAPFALTKSVFTMHDVSPFTRPQYYPDNVRRRLTWMIKRGLSTAKLVICISENCRQTTRELFGIPEERMVVVPHGISDEFHPIEKSVATEHVRRVFGLTGPYVLYVGKLEARKNICRLLRAFHRFRQETQTEAKLVLAGRRFWDLEDVDETIAELGLASEVTELGYVGNEHLAPLYSAAEVFLFPTLWEGFGFPVLEAMKCGTPVITSNVSCLPEVAAGAAVLVDPTSVEEMASAITQMVSDESERRRIVAAGLARAAEYTWSATARQTIEAYETALNA